MSFALFVMLTPFPGTLDFVKWEKEAGSDVLQIGGVPLTRYWLVPPDKRPKVYLSHPTMSAEDVRLGTQQTWDQFSLCLIWHRARFLRTRRARLAFLLISKPVPSDVREHGYCDRQRSDDPLGSMGALAGEAMPAFVRERPRIGSAKRHRSRRSRFSLTARDRQ